MTASPNTEFADYIVDLLDPIGSIESRRFFGGIALVSESKQFAMLMVGTLYFCVDDSTREKYEGAGMEPFSYKTKKKRVLVRRYYEVPEDLLENADELIAWAREAIAVASQS